MTLTVPLFCLFFCPLGSTFRDRASYPNIQDVVSFKTHQHHTEEEGSELTIDIEKLDIHKVKNDDTAFRNQLMGGFGGNVLQETPVKKTRRTENLQVFADPRMNDVIFRLKFRSKMADVMLQLIYMARSKIRSFERLGYINQESSEYRVGIVVRKMENLYYKARRYYTVMVEKQNKGKWDTESTSILNMHHKVVMAHHDFTHLYFVQMRLHERLNQIYGIPIHSTKEPHRLVTGR